MVTETAKDFVENDVRDGPHERHVRLTASSDLWRRLVVPCFCNSVKGPQFFGESSIVRQGLAHART